MTFWILRLVTIILAPIIAWFTVSSDWKGIAVGVVLAILIIAIEIIIEMIPLSHLLVGLFGSVIGLLLAWGINTAITFVNEPHLSTVMGKASPLLYLIFT